MNAPFDFKLRLSSGMHMPKKSRQEWHFSVRTRLFMGMEAEQAVHDTIKGLVASGKQAYTHSVPPVAENLPVRHGKGREALAQASSRVRAAIDLMSIRGVVVCRN
jgi:hypothetical protein